MIGDSGGRIKSVFFRRPNKRPFDIPRLAYYSYPVDMEGVRFFSPGKDDITPVNEGYVFDLGGRKLTVIETPGHTPGSICLLDAENKLLFSGDDACPHVWLFLPESLPISTYVRSQKKLLARRADFEVVYSAHGGPFKPAYLETLLVLAKRIMNGECAKVMPYKGAGFTARSCFYNGALIAFDPDKLKDK
jgi:hydroxyacylglutathione hydrolase